MINQIPKITGIKNIEYFTKGHRGILYTGEYKKKKVVIKVKLEQSKAFGRIENEGNWLKRLNKKNIGPKLIKANKDYVVYYFVSGLLLIEFIKNLKSDLKNRDLILKLIRDVFCQCFVMDKISVDKEEMHFPIKHIIVTKKRDKILPVLLDFERCHIVQGAKNVTQFSMFMLKIRDLLQGYGIKVKQERIIGLAKVYKRYPSQENFNKILKEFV